MRIFLLILSIFTLLQITGCSTIQNKVESITGSKFKNDKQAAPFFKMIWNRSFDPIYDSGNLPISLGIPFIFDDLLYVGDQDGNIYAWNNDNGKPLWKFKESIALGAQPGIFKDQLIYGSGDGRVFSRHYLTGALNWSVDLGSQVESKPYFYQGRIFFHLRNHKIISLDAITGKILWGYQRSVPYSTTLQGVSNPVGIDNKIIVGFADGVVGAFSIDDGVLLWETKINLGTKFVDVDLNPIIKNDKIYIGTSGSPINVLNVNNGQLVQTWPQTSSATPLLLNEEMILGSPSGEIFKCDLEGNIIAQSRVSRRQITDLKVWKARILVEPPTDT
ncbi:MAG: PQQ-binding-like beta-propeller repeat protein [Bacteriovoracaceae bacterium]